MGGASGRGIKDSHLFEKGTFISKKFINVEKLPLMNGEKQISKIDL